MKFTLFVIALIVVGCSSDGTTDLSEDAGLDADPLNAQMEDARIDGLADSGTDTPANDLESTDDTGLADASDVADSGRCTGDCATLDLRAMVGQNSAEFDHAYYGLTSPEQSEDGVWELHVEVHAGWPGGCPEMDSPTPDQTLIVTGMRFPEFPGLVTDGDGLVVTLVDFTGDLTDELPYPATGEELQFLDWELCTDCPGDHAEGFLAFDLTAPFDDGMATGHVYATHCSSLDAR